MDAQTKKCRVCGEIKPITEFSKHPTEKYGVAGKCKPCVSAYVKSLYHANPEPVKARIAQWQKDNPEKARAYRIKSKKKNRANIMAYNTKYNKEHKAQMLVRCRNRQARLLNAPGGGWTVEQRQQLVEDYGHRCAYCGREEERIELDHIVPITRGGEHIIENAVPACRSCNASKGNKPLLIWMWQQRSLSSG